MPEPTGAPHFHVLTRKKCESLLARNHVGRVAFVRGNRVDVIPIHYVFANGVLCGRTARGTRLDEASDNFNDSWPVAFEIDEIDGLFRWRSVVVHGNLHAATRSDAERQRSQGDWEEAVRAIRTLIPDAFTENDPTRFRDILVRIDVAEMSGREAGPGA